MKLYHCILLFFLVTSAALTNSVRANEPDPFNKRLLPVELVMSFRKEINLTKQQANELGKLVVQMQQSVAQKQWEMQSDYFALIEALDKSPIDEDEALSLVRSAVDAENAIKVEQVRLLIRLRNLLNADQIQFLREQLNNGWSDS